LRPRGEERLEDAFTGGLRDALVRCLQPTRGSCGEGTSTTRESRMSGATPAPSHASAAFRTRFPNT
jgi:hypothetical protein